MGSASKSLQNRYVIRILENFSLFTELITCLFCCSSSLYCRTKKSVVVKFSPLTWIGAGIKGSLQVQQQKDKQYADRYIYLVPWYLCNLGDPHCPDGSFPIEAMPTWKVLGWRGPFVENLWYSPVTPPATKIWTNANQNTTTSDPVFVWIVGGSSYKLIQGILAEMPCICLD